MTTQREPYFMKNKDWYYHDPVEFKYKLTEKAPPEAVKSYEEFYSDPISTGEDMAFDGKA